MVDVIFSWSKGNGLAKKGDIWFMSNTAKEVGGILLALCAGLLIAMLTLSLFQLQTGGVFPPLETHDREAYIRLYDHFLPFHIQDDIKGLCVGIFAGALITALLCRQEQKKCVLLMPVLFVLLLFASHWPFRLPKEFIWLALPVWVLIALIAHYLVNFIKKRRARGQLAK